MLLKTQTAQKININNPVKKNKYSVKKTNIPKKKKLFCMFHP